MLGVAWGHENAQIPFTLAGVGIAYRLSLSNCQDLQKLCLSIFCPSDFTSEASLVAQLVKNPPAMQETWEDPLEKGKATHSSNLAWRIPWTV